MKQLLQKWLQSFDSNTSQKAQNYIDTGKVSLIFSNNEITGKVQGSSKNPYLFRVQLKNGELFAGCSCPVGMNCKHLFAAASIALKHLSFAKEKDSSALSPAESQWLSQLEHQTAISEKRPSTAIVYSIRRSASHKIEIYLYKMKVLKSGALSTSSARNYDIGSLLRYLPEEFKNAMQPQDWTICNLLWQNWNRPTSVDKLDLLQKLVATGRCFQSGDWKEPLRWGEPLAARFEWTHSEFDMQRLHLKTENPSIECALASPGACYLGQGLCGPLDLGCEYHLAQKLLEAPSIKKETLPLVQEKLKQIAPQITVHQKETLTIKGKKPTPHLKVGTIEGSVRQIATGHLSFLYEGKKLPYSPEMQSPEETEREGITYVIYRDHKEERNHLFHLLRTEWRAMDDFFVYGLDQNFFTSAVILRDEVAPALEKEGWVVEFSPTFPVSKVSHAEDWYVEAQETGGNNWFDLELGTLIDGKRVNLLPALRTLFQTLQTGGFSFDQLSEKDLMGKIALPLGNGEVLLTPLSRIKPLFETLLSLLNTDQKKDKIQVSSWDIPNLTALQESGKLEWQMPQKYQELQNRFKAQKKIQKIAKPKELKCDLRPYQLEGISWLQFLRSCDLNGVLADDMGLGKTVQTLAHILIEKEAKRMKHPALIIAPTSLMGNWLTEAGRFAPKLKVLILQGDKRRENFDKIAEHDLILTTYPLIARDKDTLLDQKFHFLILDEAQNIKNAKTQAHQVICEIQANHKLCLTGTPMENHLGELWSLFHVLLPGFLGSEKQFQQLFRKPIEKEGSLERKKILQRRILPFMLRRTKQEVILDLPPKTEILHTLELTPKQKDLYEAVRLTLMKKVLEEVKEKGLGRSKIIVLDALLKLRQICCDPRLVKSAQDATPDDSSKIAYLRETLPQMIQEGRKIILFSQFTSLLSLLEQELKTLSIPYSLLTGDTKERLTPVQNFQEGKVPLILISLKAGGTGLNLTAADTVIHYDPWWNPAVENQATDRAHRMGQVKPVFVYKLIAAGSLEEKILSLQAKKKALADGLFDASNSAPLEMDLEELESLFEPISHQNPKI